MPTGPYAAEIQSGIARLDEVLQVDLRKSGRNTSVFRMSEAGKCGRQLAYKLLGYPKASESDQLHAIWAAGHVFEQLALAGMRVAGLPVYGAQDELSGDNPPMLGHHDGRTVIDGVESVLEVKSANDARFGRMVAQGVAISDPDYYTQMQIYMHHNSLNQAFYVAVNKNNSDVYTELVDFDPDFTNALLDRLRRVWQITRDQELPEPEYHKSSQECRRCPFEPLCPGLSLPPRNGTGDLLIVSR